MLLSVACYKESGASNLILITALVTLCTCFFSIKVHHVTCWVNNGAGKNISLDKASSRDSRLPQRQSEVRSSFQLDFLCSLNTFLVFFSLLKFSPLSYSVFLCPPIHKWDSLQMNMNLMLIAAKIRKEDSEWYL